MSLKEKAIALRDKTFSCSSASMKEQLGYAGGSLGSAMSRDVMDTYSDKFGRDFAKISDRMMLIINNAATAVSFALPPVVGAWVDSPQKGRISHLRAALRTMPIPFALTALLLFIVPSSTPIYNFIWIIALRILFDAADTFYDIAMTSLGFKLCTDPKDRAGFFTLASLASTVGSMLPGWIIPFIVGATDDLHSKQWRYFYVALVFCVLGVVSMYLPYFTTGERIDAAIGELARKKRENEQEHVQWNRETISAILHNRPFMIAQLSLIFETIRKVTFKALPILYDNILGDFRMKGIIDPISGALSYVGLAAVPFVGKKISARNMMIGGYGYTSFFYVVMALFNFGGRSKGSRGFDRGHIDFIRKFRWVIGACLGLAGMPNAAQGAAKKIIIADSTDYMEWYGYRHFGTQIRSDGILSSASNIITKVSSLVQRNLYDISLIASDYKYNTDKTDAIVNKYKLKEAKVSEIEKRIPTNDKYWGVLGKLFLAISLCGLIGNVLAGAVFLFDNFTGRRRDQILEELNVERKKRELVMAQVSADAEESAEPAE